MLAAAATEQTTPALRRTMLPRTAQRLHRTAIERVAAREGINKLELEDIYTNVRSALAHLIAHDRYRTYIEDRTSELLRRNREMLDVPGAAQYFGELELKAARQAFERFEQERAHLRAPETEAQKQLFDSIDFAMKQIHAIMSRPDVIVQLGQAKVARIDNAASELDKARDELLQMSAVKPAHVALFVKVIDELGELYDAEHYDRSDIIAEKMMTMARLILVNFGAYDTTLNT